MGGAYLIEQDQLPQQLKVGQNGVEDPVVGGVGVCGRAKYVHVCACVHTGSS